MGSSGTITVSPSILTASGPGSQTKTAFGELLVQQLTPQVLVHFPYNINTDIVSTSVTGTGTVTHSGQFAIMSSSAAINSGATLSSKSILEYNPGIGALCRFTAIWGTGTAGNKQVAGIGNTTDGFFFGYNGTSFGIMRLDGSSENWTDQTDWNADPYDGTGKSGNTLDTTKGNVFQIRFQWLGFGAISFYIENENSGSLDLVHTIQFTNQNTDTSINNPSLPFSAYSINTTNDTDIVLKIPSIGMFIEGVVNETSFTKNAVTNEKTISTEQNVLTVRNKSTYQGITNEVQIEPSFLTVSADGTKNVTINAYINATLGGTPSYTDISTNTSVVDYDTAGTTVTGGKLVFITNLSKAGDKTIDVTGLNTRLRPGDSITFSALSSANNDVSVGLMWQERFS